MPHKGDHVSNVEGGNEVSVIHPDITNQEIREALRDLAQAVTTQLNLSIVPSSNVVESTMTSLLRDFVRISPLIFLVSKV